MTYVPLDTYGTNSLVQQLELKRNRFSASFLQLDGLVFSTQVVTKVQLKSYSSNSLFQQEKEIYN